MSPGVERVERALLEGIEREAPISFERCSPGFEHREAQGVVVDAGVLSDVGVDVEVDVGAVVGVTAGVDDPRFLFGRNAHTSAAVTTMMTSAHTTAWMNSRRSRGGL